MEIERERESVRERERVREWERERSFKFVSNSIKQFLSFIFGYINILQNGQC